METMMINEQLLTEVAQVYAARNANHDGSPWEYDAHCFNFAPKLPHTL